MFNSIVAYAADLPILIIYYSREAVNSMHSLWVLQTFVYEKSDLVKIYFVYCYFLS